MEKKTLYFNELALRWLEEMRGSHALSTIVKYTQLSQKHIFPFFQNVEISCITSEMLQEFQNRIRECKSLSPGNLRCISMIVNTVLRYAYQENMLPTQMAICINTRKQKHIAKVFNKEEQRQLEQYLLNNITLSTLGIYMCLYTGLRLGEICSLRWSDINIESNCIFVRHTIQRLSINNEKDIKKTQLVLSAPKSNSSTRLIPITSNLIRLLQNQKANHGNNDYLLTGMEIPMEPRTFQYQYKKHLQNATVPYYNFHALRHTFATKCIMCGMDPKTLSEILGHSDIKITLEYYFHTSLEFKKQQMELLCSVS